jgi:hypothetical protein
MPAAGRGKYSMEGGKNAGTTGLKTAHGFLKVENLAAFALEK